MIGIVAVVCAVAGVVFATQVRLDRSSPFYVARLSDDEHEAYGRIFREKINEWLEVLEVETRVAREPAIVETPEHARASLRSTAGHALVWGDRRWVNVLLSEPTEVLLASLDDLLFPEYGAFKIVSSVPAIGMSLESVDGTARFLGTAFATMKMSDDGAVSDAEIELFWRQAANTAGLWTTYAHRALPWLKIGNLHFIDGISGEGYEPAELECARNAYRTGLASLILNENPELKAALLNNFALVQYVRQQVEQRRGLLGKASEHLKESIAMVNVPNNYELPYHAPYVAAHNLELVRVRAGYWRAWETD